jgi:exopolysaccharide production protein ExoQ
MAWDRPPATNADLGGSPVDRMLMISLMVLGLYVLHLRWNQTKRLLTNNKWIVALFAYMALSILWSNFPGITVRRCFRSMGALEMALVVLTERDPLGAVRALMQRVYRLIIPLSVYAIRYLRNIGVVYSWDGVFEEWIGTSTDKNSLGQAAMCGGLFFLWDILHDWPRRKTKRILRSVLLEILILGMSLFLLHGSKNVHSSTSIVGFLACSFVLIALQFIKKRSARAKRIVLGGAIVAAFMAPFVFLAFEAFDTTPVQIVVDATGRDMTFTDRTLIWTDVLNNTAKHPILGVGMGAYWVGPIGYDMYPMPNWSRKTPSWRPEEGHNGYLDVYVELGAVGEALMLCIIVNAFIGSLTHLETDFQFGSLRLTLLLSIVINNITETSYLKGTHEFWFLFVLFAMNPPRPARKAISKRSAMDVKALEPFDEEEPSGDVYAPGPLVHKAEHSVLRDAGAVPGLRGLLPKQSGSFS